MKFPEVARHPFSRITITTLICLALYANTAAAHSGRTNSSGCHGGSRPYHCHNGSSSSASRKKYTAPAADRASTKPKKATVRLNDVPLQKSTRDVTHSEPTVQWQETTQPSVSFIPPVEIPKTQRRNPAYKWRYDGSIGSVQSATGYQLSYHCKDKWLFIDVIPDGQNTIGIDGKDLASTIVPLKNRIAVNASKHVLRAMRAGRVLTLRDATGQKDFSLMGFTAVTKRLAQDILDCR